jgi:hypothetical protein
MTYDIFSGIRQANREIVPDMSRAPCVEHMVTWRIPAVYISNPREIPAIYPHVSISEVSTLDAEKSATPRRLDIFFGK